MLKKRQRMSHLGVEAAILADLPGASSNEPLMDRMR